MVQCNESDLKVVASGILYKMGTKNGEGERYGNARADSLHRKTSGRLFAFLESERLAGLLSISEAALTQGIG